MRQFSAECETKLDEAARQWAEERSRIIATIEETRSELESHIEFLEGVLLDLGIRQCRQLVV